MSFLNKVVLVTGASSGVGASAALHFARLSAKLVLVGRNTANLEKVKEDCLKAYGRNTGLVPLIIVADVGKDAVRIIETTKSHFGQLDVLINNAGIVGEDNILSMNMEKYDEIMNTNLRAVVNITSLAAPMLVETRGNVVNISSTVAVKPSGLLLTYGLSKAALNYFTRTVALQLAAQKVRVNAIVLGFADTGINAYLDPRIREVLIKAMPLGEAVELDDVSRLIAYLASDAAKAITGELVSIDGGRSAL